MALKFAVNNSLSAVTSLPTAIPTGSMTLLQTQTASNSSSLEFTTDINSTYDVYCFSYINCHPITDNVQFQINLSTDGGSNYNVTKTNSHFHAAHKEDDSNTFLSYASSYDLAQSTNNMAITDSVGNDADHSASGYLYLYNPSNTTFVKHILSVNNSNFVGTYTMQSFVGAYANTTSAIDAVRFTFSSGNIDSGDIKLYGIS
jgi:hypothetical protein